MRWWALHERKSEYGKEKLGGMLGLARVEFSKEKRRATRWFGPKTKKEEMGCEIFFSNLIKGFRVSKTKGLNFFKSILNWTQNITESNRVLGTLQN
jgi:hypothetical protein